MKETITKIKIVEELHKSIGLSKNECSLFLEEVIAKFQSTLEENKNIKIANFGSFIVRQKNARIGIESEKTIEVVISSP